MNFQTLAPFVGEQLAALLVNGENVVQLVLSAEQKRYMAENWHKLPVWLGTEEGQIALQTFFEDWRSNCK